MKKKWLALLIVLLTGLAAEAQVTDVVLRPGEIPKGTFNWMLRSVADTVTPLINPPGVDPGVRTGAAGIGGLLPASLLGQAARRTSSKSGCFGFRQNGR